MSRGSLPSTLLYLSFLSLLPFVLSQLSVYTVYPDTPGAINKPEDTAPCISAGACDGHVLVGLQNPAANAMTKNVEVRLYNGQHPPGVNFGREVSGSFLGFSIELSVSNHILGNNGDEISPTFLNLMATLTGRAGKVLIRVGGNSQERATVILEGLPKGAAINKTDTDKKTPTINVSPNLIYAMSNISSFVDVDWFIGLPFDNPAAPRPIIAQLAQKLLGDRLVGMQLGNEPDLYKINGLRGENYAPADFTREWGEVAKLYKSDPQVPVTNHFVAPSVCCGPNPGWTPDQIWETGFLDQYKDDVKWVSVEHYPSNNCNSSGTPYDPEELLGRLYLNHNGVKDLVRPYLNSANLAYNLGKEFIMFETNTASCSGFSGLSDSFAAALWSVDYNLNMATNNFTNALYHVGGQRAYYNPFTPPPTNQSRFRQWTIGPVMYSALATAEALGTTGKARVQDLGLNGDNVYSPGYAIYEDNIPTRVVLINFLTDPSGAANYTANIAIGGGNTGTALATPATITVKYLLAPSAVDKWNITWAGQSFGGPHASDGRLHGDVQKTIVTCDQARGICPVNVPAPAVAVVFLSDKALQESEPEATQTFATTVETMSRNTVTIDPSVLATSNGHGGQDLLQLGSTSFGSANDAVSLRHGAGIAAAIAVTLICTVFKFMHMS